MEKSMDLRTLISEFSALSMIFKFLLDKLHDVCYNDGEQTFTIGKGLENEKDIFQYDR